MIDPEWQLVDLDPGTWRAIGEYFHPGRYIRAGAPEEHGLFILHDSGRPLNVVDTHAGRRIDLAGQRVDDPAALAEHLYLRGEWDRVHVIDRAHLKRVANLAQDATGRQLHLDEYYRRVYHLIWDGDHGYVAAPPKVRDWNGWTYDGIRQVVAQLQEPSSLALGVIDDREVRIGLVIEVRVGTIRKVTTFEALRITSTDLHVSSESLSAVWTALKTHCAPPAAAMLCTKAVFDAWIVQQAKAQTIETAVQAGMAFVRLQDQLAQRNGWTLLNRSR
jgi:hypothetical protein